MLYNVSTTHHDHVCIICGAQKQRQLHAQVERVQTDTGIVLVLECENGHQEFFNNALAAAEETSPTRDEASREQVRNVRLLYQHHGTGTQ